MDRRRKLFVNPLEEMSHQQSTAWSKNTGFDVHSKTGLSQALELQGSGLDHREYSYALKASFDFIVTRPSDGQILFAIEVDGPSHRSIESHGRDRLKNSICQKLGMPLIRVGPKAVETKLEGFTSALTWLATLCPYAEALEEAYASGTIPDDEIVFPTDIISNASGRLGFHLDPTSKTIGRIWQFVHQGHVLQFPCILHAHNTGMSAGGVITFALAFVPTGVFSGIGGCLDGSRLPIPESDVSTALCLLDLEAQVLRYIQGSLKPLVAHEVIAKMQRLGCPDEWIFDEGDGIHPAITVQPAGGHPRR